MGPDDLTPAVELPVDEALCLLRDGELAVEGRLVEASNTTLYCAVSRGELAAACVYKPVAGERPLWDFPDGTLAEREIAAYEVSAASGWGIVPPTVYRDGPLGPGMVQLWIDGDPTVLATRDTMDWLATLTSENAFVQSVQGEPGTYRYHRLFAELLYAQLVLEQPDQAPLLHRRAAEWLFDRGQVIEALRHATEAEDWALACTMIVEDYAVARLAIDGTAGRAGAMLRRLPDHGGGPETAVVRAALALAAGRRDECRREIALTERLLGERGNECGDALMLACLLINILVLAAGPDASQALRWVAVAETFLGVAPMERLLRHPELRIVLLAAKGAALSRCGETEAAAMAFAEGAETAPEGCEHPQLECLQQLALLEAHQGRLGRADALARRALDLAAQCGLDRLHRPVGADLALAWVALERYDIETADHHLRTAHHHLPRGGDGLAVAAYALVRTESASNARC